MAKLTDQQRLFCARFVRLGNATQAAEDAGYKTPNVDSARLVKKPQVAAEIERLKKKVAKTVEKLQEERDRKTIADVVEVQEFFTSVMRGEEEEEELSLSGDAVPKKAALNTRMQAGNSLAKLNGWLKDRVEHTGKDGEPIELKGVGFRELLEMAKLGGDE